MGISINANVDPVKKLARQLRKADPVVAKKLRGGVKEAGELVADRARELSSFSTKIPGTIRTRAVATTVTIVAGNDKVPQAALFERATGWRHPLFGNKKHWYDEGPRRFLQPALDDKAVEAQRKIIDAVMEAVDEVMDTGE